MQHMINKYLPGVADYLNNKFGDDFTMAEPFYELTLDKPQRVVIVRDWSKVDAEKQRWYAEAQAKEMNLVGYEL